VTVYITELNKGTITYIQRGTKTYDTCFFYLKIKNVLRTLLSKLTAAHTFTRRDHA